MEYTHTSAVQTWDPAHSGNARWCIRLFPSLTDFAFMVPAFLLFVILPGTKRLFTDGDTGWHIRAGEWILQHGAVPKTDLFSFTKPHDAWFAWEWGWDLCFAMVHQFWGLAGVAFINACLLCVISVLLFRLIRRCCDNDVLSLLFTIIAMCGSTIHWLARPHLLSWVFVLVFLHVLVSAEQGRVRLLAWLPVLMLLWTNLHGGFVVGIIIILAAALGEACRALTAAQPSCFSACSKAKPYLLCSGACIAATFVNPYTWRLHEHVFSYLSDSKLLDNIVEYQSISFHHGAALFFECMLLLGGGSVWWCVRCGKLTAAILTVLWAHLALLSGRNIPLFMFVASPWAACMFRDLLSSAKVAPYLSRFTNTASEICKDLRPFERIGHLHVASGLTVALMAVLFAAGKPGFEAQFNATLFPIQAVPALSKLVKTRVFTYDQWGDYLIYRFYPDARVFMDGRSDFYGHDFVDTYLQLMNADYRWESDLKRYAIETVVLKPDAPLAKVLKQSHEWTLLFDNGSVLVFRAGFNANTDPFTRASYHHFSPVSQDGGNGPGLFKRASSSSQFTNHERRSS